MHVRRGSEKLGHASAQRIEAMLSNSVLDSSVERISLDLNREWDLIMTVHIR